jgi:hypothetical protein
MFIVCSVISIVLNIVSFYATDQQKKQTSLILANIYIAASFIIVALKQ